MKPSEIRPTHRKPNKWHDEHKRSIYHITLVCNDREPVLGRIVGNSADEARCELSPLGIAVSRCINAIPMHGAEHGRQLKVLACQVMPEHCHFVLFVQEDMECKLGDVIRGLKQGCNKALRAEVERQRCGGSIGRGTPDVCNGEGGVLQDGAGQEGGVLQNGAGQEAGALQDGAGQEGGALQNGAGQEGGALQNGAGQEGGALQNGAGQEGGVLQNGAGQEGGALQNGAGLCSAVGTSGLAVVGDGANLASSAGGVGLFHLEKALPIKSPKMVEGHRLFDDDFDRTPLIRKGQLLTMIKYVHNNPRHRWLKHNRPQLLCPIRGVVVAGRSYDAIGNVNLLGLDRFQVHARRIYTEQQHREHQNECVLKARNGYALVSPFVNEREVAVRDFCLKEGHSVIVLHNNGFTDFTQCPGALYDYCVRGQVLVLVPSAWPHDDRKSRCTRQECQLLNGCAAEIVAE